MGIDKDKSVTETARLRRRADDRLKTPAPKVRTPWTEKERQRLAHELEVHQTELEMQNEELRQSRDEVEMALVKYADLYDFAPIGYITFDSSGLIWEVNLAGAKLMGIERSSLLKRPFMSFIANAADKEIFSKHCKEVFQKQGSQTCEISLKRRVGATFYAQIQSMARKTYDGKAAYVRSTITDITEHKKIEEQLQKTYDEMELLVKERTKNLVIANQQLMQEIEERKKAEESLQEALNEVKELKNRLREENLYLREEINLMHSHKDIVGNSEEIEIVLKKIEQVAPTDSTVLIQGETGTGKELIAHAIHDLSRRKGRLMIKVNCAALPPTLIESELFGREKGAFTGALSKQIGRFELANSSTIFLDEIDALPLELQAKLLRVIESGEFERLGNPKTVKVDVRIIAATNRDLASVVSKGGFRDDLFYRLNVFQIIVPPLRERRADILPLIWSFVQDFSKRMGKRIESIPQKEVDALQAYPWPGNIRELRNITEREMILATGPVLHLHVPRIVQTCPVQSGTLEEVEKHHIIEALNATGWRVSGRDGAAEMLGLNPKTLESRMQRLGIQRKKKNA
jgi:formate hydrogenlyase transcriptional activator